MRWDPDRQLCWKQLGLCPLDGGVSQTPEPAALEETLLHARLKVGMHALVQYLEGRVRVVSSHASRWEGTLGSR